jgi:chorismate mutase
MNLYPKNLKNRLLGLAKAPIIDDRKLIRIKLIRINLRSLRSSILGSFRSSRKTDFSGSLGIQEIRKEIDLLDRQIIPLLDKRFQLVSQLLGKKKSLTDKPREQEILNKIKSVYVQNIYRSIFRQSKKLLLSLGFERNSLP